MLSILVSAALAAVTVASKLPSFTRGAYLILADNTVSVQDDNGNWVPSIANWNPRVSTWIQNFNVLFFSFIDADMQVPKSFTNLRQSGQIPAGTKIMYSVGGASYSQQVDKWRQWFGSADKARQLAQQVA